jgi:hypothetical protein
MFTQFALTTPAGLYQSRKRWCKPVEGVTQVPSQGASCRNMIAAPADYTHSSRDTVHNVRFAAGWQIKIHIAVALSPDAMTEHIVLSDD